MVFQPFFQKCLLTHPVGKHEQAAAPGVRKGWTHLLGPRAAWRRGPEPGGDPGSPPRHPSARQPELPCSGARLPFLPLFLLGKFDQVASERAAEQQALGATPPPHLVSMVTGYGLPHRPVWGHTHTRTHSRAPSSPASPGPAPHLAPPSWWLWTSWSALLRLFLSAEWALPDPPQGAMEDRVCLGATGSGAGAGRPHGRGRPQLG